MSDLYFQRGEILTATKLNQLVQAVTTGAPPAAVGNGNVSPSQPHQVRQREFSSYVPFRRPIYIDQTSPHWPLANGTPGWYWRDSESSSLTPFPHALADGDTVYLKTELSPLGIVQEQQPILEEEQNVAWNPFENKGGVLVEKLGSVSADPYKTGTKANTLLFVEAPASPAVPVLAASASSTNVPGGWVPSFLPPATYLKRASLLGPRTYNTQILNTINSDGGLVLKYFNEIDSGVCSGGVEIIPRLVILPAPSTEPPLPPCAAMLGNQLAPGSWHEMAAVNIEGRRLALNMAWLNPWMAYINMSLSEGSGPLLHQTWKKTWGKPVSDSPPPPFAVDNGAWHEVSRTSCYLKLLIPHYFPANCAWVMQEEKILQATGSYAPGTNEDGDTIRQPVLFQAYLRRKVAPCTGCWCIWYDACWTNIYD